MLTFIDLGRGSIEVDEVHSHSSHVSGVSRHHCEFGVFQLVFFVILKYWDLQIVVKLAHSLENVLRGLYSDYEKANENGREMQHIIRSVYQYQFNAPSRPTLHLDES